MFIACTKVFYPNLSKLQQKTCVQILTQYIVLFPEAQRVGRFLRYFQDEKSTNRPVGKNKIAEYPKRVATFLGLSPEGFTGHCWRRTTATILSETDIPLIQFKNAGGWHSDSVCQGYVQESKRQNCRSLQESLYAKIIRLVIEAVRTNPCLSIQGLRSMLICPIAQGVRFSILHLII